MKWVRIGNSSGVFLSIGSGGRTTIASGVFTSAAMAAGSIDNTTIGSSTPSTGKFHAPWSMHRELLKGVNRKYIGNI